MDFSTLKAILQENEGKTKHYLVIRKDGYNKKERLILNNDFPFMYMPRKRKWGHYVGRHEMEEWETIKPIYPTETIKHMRHTLKKAIKYLDASGLWEGLNNTFKALLEMSDEELTTLRDMEYTPYCERMAQIANEHNGTSCSMDMFFALMNKSIKTINYPRWEKDTCAEMFDKAIKNKSEHYHRWVKGYDNSISCNIGADGQMRAWYSEEYRNCANGHYYLALDAKHALYCEDD